MPTAMPGVMGTSYGAGMGSGGCCRRGTGSARSNGTATPSAMGFPEKVFCASMADVFEDHSDLEEPRKRLWDLIEATPWLCWQLLTKRPENVAGMAPWGDEWPSWVWLGVSAENQRWADTRIPVLLEIPARTKFISAEPLLGPIDLGFDHECGDPPHYPCPPMADWLII